MHAKRLDELFLSIIEDFLKGSTLCSQNWHSESIRYFHLFRIGIQVEPTLFLDTISPDGSSSELAGKGVADHFLDQLLMTPVVPAAGFSVRILSVIIV